MPKATDTPTTSRRILLGTVAALPVAVLSVAAMADVGGPDAELLATWRTFIGLEHQMRMWNDGKIDLTDEASALLSRRWYAALARATELPPHTPDGLRTKALVAYLAMDSVRDSSWGSEEEAAFSVLAHLTGRT